MARKSPRPRPFTPAQQRQNAAFLAALGRTGNVRLACRELGVHRATYTKRRGKCAAFAAEWDMALIAAHAAFQRAGGVRLPEAHKGDGARSSRAKSRGARDDSEQSPFDFAQDERNPSELRTRGGEPVIVRQANGRLQLRLAPPGRMTEAAAQLFLATLSASANIRLSARLAGFAHSSFYARRWRDPGFAREERLAIEIGCDRLDWALTMRARQALSPAWRSEGPDAHPLPRMSVGQCVQLVTMHQNAAIRHGGWGAWRNWRGAGEGAETGAGDGQGEGAGLDWATDRPAERARHYEATGSWRLPDEPAAPVVPDLEQALARGSGSAGGMTVRVTYHSDRALFGGWRLDTWEKRKKAG